MVLLAIVGVSCSESDLGEGKTAGILQEEDTMGMAAPEHGRVLLSDAWVNEGKEGELGWDFEDGVLTIVPGAGNLRTRESFGDCRMHVEFNVSQTGDGNSGVYIQRRYEIQILDSFVGKPSDVSCGAIYTQRGPSVNVSRAAGEWQVYDIVFRAPRWEGDQKVENARVSVLHNGVLIHDDVAIVDKTGHGKEEGNSEAPLRLQDHGSATRFRNVWIERLNLD